MFAKTAKFLNKWLPIFFGCHCRPDRSFFYKGRKLPICARCTGELVGVLLSLLSCAFWLPPAWVLALMLLPLIIDGTVQQLSSYESGNIRRLLTGILFGYGIFGLFALSVKAVYGLGWSLGMKIKNN